MEAARRLGAVLGQRADGLDLYENVLGREVPFPSLADVGYLGAPPLAAAALLTLPFAAPSLAGWVRQVLDGLMIAASLLLASWVLVLHTLFEAGADNGFSQAISLAYPIGDVVVGTIVLFVLARARSTRSPPGSGPTPSGASRSRSASTSPASSSSTPRWSTTSARPWKTAACPRPRWSWR